MRITNSMLVNNLMRNLNDNFNKVDKLQNMMASGRKFAHISSDPIALIYSQAARNKIARLEHYQTTVGSAKDWLNQSETGMMELQKVMADAYEACVDATHDGKTDGDKQNIAQVVGQLREHFVDTLNAAFGDKYVYAAYNTPGDAALGLGDEGIKSFTVVGEKLYFNGFDLSKFDGMPAELLNVNLSGLSHADAVIAIDGLNVNLGSLTHDDVIMLHKLKSDVLSFDVGPGINMPVTMNGIDVVLFTTIDKNGDPVVRNAFNVLSDLYYGTNGDPSASPPTQPLSASELTMIIKPLQDAQNHLLTETAVIGGRTRRLELLEARYEQDSINYQRMMSDAEDVDMAEVIMRLRIAESVMQSAMSAGARVIQPSLMDFLR
jgi:flagellar hook-associated protein 3 FlgL